MAFETLKPCRTFGFPALQDGLSGPLDCPKTVRGAPDVAPRQPETAPGAPKTAQGAPRRRQDGSKGRTQNGKNKPLAIRSPPNRRPRNTEGLQEAPTSRQEAQKRPPRVPQATTKSFRWTQRGTTTTHISFKQPQNCLQEAPEMQSTKSQPTSTRHLTHHPGTEAG